MLRTSAVGLVVACAFAGASVAVGQQVAPGTNLARVANDSMAELVRKHPDRFVGFAAALECSTTGTRMITSSI